MSDNRDLLIEIGTEELPPKVMRVPSTTIRSLTPSARPPTVKVSPAMPCPLSKVPTAAPLKTVTGTACVPAPVAKILSSRVAGRAIAAFTPSHPAETSAPPGPDGMPVSASWTPRRKLALDG